MTKPETDVAEVLERLRRQTADLRQGQPQPAIPASAVRPVWEKQAPQRQDLNSLRLDVDTALTGHRDFAQINPRPPGLKSGLIQFFKKAMRRSLSWYTRPLHVFQAAVIRALRQIIVALESQGSEIREASQTAGDFRRQLTEQQRTFEQRLSTIQADAAESAQRHSRDLESLRTQLSRERQELLTVIQSQRSRERDVRRLIHAVESQGIATSAEVEQNAAAHADSMDQLSEFDYFAFEDRYRGDEKSIRDRQREYVEYFRGRTNVVDLGCGRGEFLELLRDNGIPARGVEQGLDQVLLCREKGFDVMQANFLPFLESLPDESLGGLFSAQVLEHLPAHEQLRYVALAYRKTSPGSPVIFETINAQSVYAILNNYLLDPTHVRLMHPKLLEFAMQSAKFRDVQLKFMAPVSSGPIPLLKSRSDSSDMVEFNSAILRLNELIYGCQDYAAIGWR